jgi:hypothetical protein
MFRLNTVLLFSMAAAGLVACAGNDTTGPEQPADQVDQAAPIEADLPSTKSEAEVPAGSLAVTATRLPKSFFVNPHDGSDTNPGSKLKPFKTLARGLSTAISGDTMRLASGDYGAAINGERFTNGSQQVLVPAGVVILGTLAGELTSHLHGTASDIGLNLKGAATVRNVVLTGFFTGIKAPKGVQVLRNVNLNQNVVGLDVRGSAQATLVGSIVSMAPKPGLIVVGVRLLEQGRFTMSGGTITGGSPNCNLGVIGIDLGGGQLTLKNAASLKNIAGPALLMKGTTKALLTSSATIDRDFSNVSGGCAPSASVLAGDSSSLTLRNALVSSTLGTQSVGIVSSSRAPLTLENSRVTRHTGAGIKALGNMKLVASGSLIEGNLVGIDAKGAIQPTITITGSTIEKNVIGVRAPFFTLRNSSVSNNSTGIVLTSPFTDLGQTYDPGNNKILNNANTGVQFDPAVIAGKVGGVFASGNTWNPFTQGSDASGQYPGKPLLNNSTPVTGKNFELPGTGFFQIQL